MTTTQTPTFADLEVVQSKQTHPAAGGQAAVRAGQVGTVVHVFSKPSPAYEVEFCDADGETLAMLTLTAEQIAKTSAPKRAPAAKVKAVSPDF